MKRAVATLILLTLTGCGAAGMPTVAGTRTAAPSLDSLSLQGDLARKLGAVAARKAVQVAMGMALKKDDKTADEWTASVSQKPTKDQLDFLQGRLKTLQHAVTVADLALSRLDGVDAVRDALKTAKDDDKAQSKAYDQLKKAADADKAQALLAWADALHRDFAAAAAAF